MILYAVEYPFPLDEFGRNQWVYTSFQEACDSAQELFIHKLQEEERNRKNKKSPGYVSRNPAVVTKVLVRELDDRGMCDVINSEGGRWCAKEEFVGSLKFFRGKIAIEASKGKKVG